MKRLRSIRQPEGPEISQHLENGPPIGGSDTGLRAHTELPTFDEGGGAGSTLARGQGVKRAHDETRADGVTGPRQRAAKRARGGEDGVQKMLSESDSEESELKFEPIRYGVRMPKSVNITAAMPAKLGRPGRKQQKSDTFNYDANGEILPHQIFEEYKPPGDRPWYAKAPKQWPPVADIGVYSHNFRVDRAFYKEILYKVGLSPDLVYGIAKGRFGKVASPDFVPFLADDENSWFKNKWEIRLPSDACILTRFDDQKDKWVYYQVDEHNFAKITSAERKFIGYGNALTVSSDGCDPESEGSFRRRFWKLSKEERKELIERRASRIAEKYARIEFFTQKNNLDGPNSRRRPSSFYERDFSDLTQAQKKNLLEDSRVRRIENKLAIDRRNSADANLIAESIVAEMGLLGKLAGNVRQKLPLMVSMNDEIFKNGDAILASRSHYCILVNDHDSLCPTYYRLNSYQTRMLTDLDRRRLGFVPSSMQKLPRIHQYQLGLLPPRSKALSDELKFSDLKDWFTEKEREERDRADAVARVPSLSPAHGSLQAENTKGRRSAGGRGTIGYHEVERREANLASSSRTAASASSAAERRGIGIRPNSSEHVR